MRSISAALWLRRRSQIVAIATATGHVSSRTPRSCLYYRFYSDCNSCIIDRRHCEIHKPSARFIAPPLPLHGGYPLARLTVTLVTVLRSAINTPRFDSTDDIRPRSGIASDKSSQMFCLSFSILSFARHFCEMTLSSRNFLRGN